MPTIEEVALELAVFKLVDHSIDKDTYDLRFTTTTTNGIIFILKVQHSLFFNES